MGTGRVRAVKSDGWRTTSRNKVSLREFNKVVQVGGFGKADKQWFPVWMKRYAEFAHHDGLSAIPLTRERAMGFSRELLANEIAAWQRQQAVRTLAAYRDVVPANKPERLPVVFSRQEIATLLPEFESLRRLMFLVMYGAGLRHAECRRPRVKDICFDEGHIVVRSGKGEKDRITVLPDCCHPDLLEQVERVRRLHNRDLENNRQRLGHALGTPEFVAADALLRGHVESMAAQCDTELADAKLRKPCRKALVSLNEHWSGLTLFV